MKLIGLFIALILLLSGYMFYIGEEFPFGEFLSGNISSVNDYTKGDGICSVSLDNGKKTVAIGSGGLNYGRAIAHGKVTNLTRTEGQQCITADMVGKRVEVFAHKTDSYEGIEHYTLSGSSLYYIKSK